jgi:hypothetical protein
MNMKQKTEVTNPEKEVFLTLNGWITFYSPEENINFWYNLSVSFGAYSLHNAYDIATSN